MKLGFLCHFALQASRCRIQPVTLLKAAYLGRLSENFPKLRYPSINGADFKLLWLKKPFQGAVCWTGIPQPISIRTVQITTDAENSKPSNLRRDLLDGTVETSALNTSDSCYFQSIQYRGVETKILNSQTLKRLVTVFVIDIETTGLCRKKGRIIEVAVRDLSGGENSCLQTLVNPKRDVPNSDIHGITTDMVNHSNVPTMEDFIPILIQYINSRLSPGGIALLVGHHARCFNVPFLNEEFSHCSMEIPSNWLFLDTLPLARKLMKLNGSTTSRASLQALHKFLKIKEEYRTGPTHRAMEDVNLLSAIFPEITFGLKLTMADLLEVSFQVDNITNSKNSKKKR